MASGAWSRTSAWGTATVPAQIPSFEDVIREQEKMKSDGSSGRSSNSKQNAKAWLDSEPWYPGVVNRNKRKKQEKSRGRKGQGQLKSADSAPVSAPSTSLTATSGTQSCITVVNLHKKDLNNSGYGDLLEWLKHPDHSYIGRDMTHYVPGAVGSKWQNPFKSKQIGRENSVKQYKEYVLTDKTVQSNGKTLFESLGELKGKTLGCWCHPERCHGHILRELVERYCQ